MKCSVELLRPSWVRKIEIAPVDGCRVPGDCWLWTGYTDKRSGYGRVTVDRDGGKYLHRVVYEMLVGPIPAGLHIDHLCRQRACCNPQHLEPVTCLVNVRRGAQCAKTHCPQGHEYSGENLYVYVNHQGTRRLCKTCQRDHLRAFHARRRAARLSELREQRRTQRRTAA